MKKIILRLFLIICIGAVAFSLWKLWGFYQFYHNGKKEYDELTEITSSQKIAAIAETGVLPDVEAAINEKAQWAYYMTWSHEFSLGEEYTSYDHLRKVYDSELSVTIDKLPKLYSVLRT